MTGNVSPNRNAVVRRWRENSREKVRAYNREYMRRPDRQEAVKRNQLRQQARHESERTGEEVQAIYTRWGCLTVREMRELASVKEAAE